MGEINKCIPIKVNGHIYHVRISKDHNRSILLNNLDDLEKGSLEEDSLFSDEDDDSDGISETKVAPNSEEASFDNDHREVVKKDEFDSSSHVSPTYEETAKEASECNSNCNDDLNSNLNQYTEKCANTNDILRDAMGFSGGTMLIWDSSIFARGEVLMGTHYVCVIGKWNGVIEKIAVINIYGPQESKQNEDVKALGRVVSDHCPVLMSVVDVNFGPKCFKIFNYWMDIEGFDNVIETMVVWKEARRSTLFIYVSDSCGSLTVMTIEACNKDDTLFFVECSKSNVRHLIHILDSFHDVSGLKINLDKSRVFRIVAFYLPWVARWNEKNDAWNDVVNKFTRRLSSWKANMLSIDGKLTLVKSVLVESIKAKNIGLMGKWKCHFLNKSGALWRRVIVELHGVNGGFDQTTRQVRNSDCFVADRWVLEDGFWLAKWVWRRHPSDQAYGELDLLANAIRHEDIFPSMQRLSLLWAYNRSSKKIFSWENWIQNPGELASSLLP
ncbi:hypothetical protein Tco_1213498 [Tanacetum coccineum]